MQVTDASINLRPLNGRDSRNGTNAMPGILEMQRAKETMEGEVWIRMQSGDDWDVSRLGTLGWFGFQVPGFRGALR